MDAHPASIRTPDQRIRVFLSSTLREWEPEREAARAAIESLRLAPVVFARAIDPPLPAYMLGSAYIGGVWFFVDVFRALIAIAFVGPAALSVTMDLRIRRTATAT